MTDALFHPQLPLSLGLRDNTLFDNFLVGDNGELVDRLSQPVSADSALPCLFLWGQHGAGKSHLLQAVCHASGARGQAAVYLPLREWAQIPIGAMVGLEQLSVVCIDDVEAIAAHLQWQEALFGLFERAERSGCLLVITGRSRAIAMGLDPALASRFSSGLEFQLKPLSDPDKRRALQLRAQRRGLHLPDAAARLLVRRSGANMAQLMAHFEQLDAASMASKRRLSVGFIRQVLGWPEIDRSVDQASQ